MQIEAFIDHDQFCELLSDESVKMVELSDGGMLAALPGGKIAHFSVLSGQGCIIAKS